MKDDNPFEEFLRQLREMMNENQNSPFPSTPGGRDLDIEDLFEQMQDRSGGFDMDDLGPEQNVSQPDVVFDVVEEDESFVVVADLPGYERDDITVVLDEDNNALQVTAERERQFEEEGTDYVRRERSFEAVNRSVELPGSVDGSDVTADYDNGVLTVTLGRDDPSEDGTEIQIE